MLECINLICYYRIRTGVGNFHINLRSYPVVRKFQPRKITVAADTDVHVLWNIADIAGPRLVFLIALESGSDRPENVPSHGCAMINVEPGIFCIISIHIPVHKMFAVLLP